jgi:glutathione S-transferase
VRLYVGNKNYSSWSMRPWVLMTHCGIGFEEVRLTLSQDEASTFKRTLAAVAPVRKVPLLVDDGFAVWDSLAIVEYLAETAPDRPVWPLDRRARARARSLCAEMHAGFSALRGLWPMNIELRMPEVGARTLREHAGLRADVERIHAMWRDALATSGGPFLMGAFSAADAFYAPVCMRLRSYAPGLPDDVAGYVEQVHDEPAVARWVADALAEHEYMPLGEPYRAAPDGPRD